MAELIPGYRRAVVDPESDELLWSSLYWTWFDMSSRFVGFDAPGSHDRNNLYLRLNRDGSLSVDEKIETLRDAWVLAGVSPSDFDDYVERKRERLEVPAYRQLQRDHMANPYGLMRDQPRHRSAV